MMDAANWGYWGIFLLMMLENVVPPVPSEAIMGAAGISIAQGRLDLALVLLAGTLGSTLGNLFWWGIGHWLGYERLRPVIHRFGRWLTMDWEDVEKLHRYFDRWGGVTVFVFRFMPIGRTIISLPAGLMRMGLWRFCAFTAGGSLVWNAILVGVGFGLGNAIDRIERFVTPVMIGCVVVFVILYLWRVATWKPHSER
jgi:membrane protein DedA with SNARE-associated domain